MIPTSEIESALVDSVECATDYQSPEVAPIWAAVQAAITGLRDRDAEIAWFERELEHATEGRRVKMRGTAEARAWLATNKTTTSINVNAYTLALDQIEALEARQTELLETVRRVSQTTPFPEEFAGWEGQRAKLVAEVGTLKARVATLEREIADCHTANGSHEVIE